MRILYVNVHDPNYPRNRRIRKFLEDSGHDVNLRLRREHKSYIVTCFLLLVRTLPAMLNCRAVILSEFSVQYAPVVWILARTFRRRLIVDAFVGMYESNVEDWQRVSPSSIKGRLYAWFDAFAVRFADCVLIDTDVRAHRLCARGAKQVLTLPVGAPQWATFEKPKAVDPMRVLYYGNYIPLHGLDFVLRNIASIPDLARFHFVFVGAGEGRPPIEALADELGLEGVIEFCDPVAEPDLRQLIAESHVVLGVFGDSPKAASVLANKVWQGLACGRTVVTRESEALEELSRVVRDQLVSVDVTDPYGLVSVLTGLWEKRALSKYSSYAGSASRLEAYTSERYMQLLNAVEKP